MNKTNVAAIGLIAALTLLSFGAVSAGRSPNSAIEWQVLSSGGAPADTCMQRTIISTTANIIARIMCWARAISRKP